LKYKQTAIQILEFKLKCSQIKTIVLKVQKEEVHVMNKRNTVQLIVLLQVP